MRYTILAAAVAFTATTASAQEALRIGTSSVGSTFYTLSVGLSEILDQHADINASVEPLGGSGPNIFGLADETIELSMVNSFTAFTGYHGLAPFSDPTDVYLLFQGQPTYRHILVRPGANISSPTDLEGKTFIGRRRALVEIEQIAEALLDAYGMDMSRVNIVETQTTPEGLEAVSVGSVDGMIVPGGMLDPGLMEAVQNGHLEFLKIDDEYFEIMAANLPDAFYVDVLPAGTYPGQDEDVRMVGMNTYIIARPGVDEETAYQVTKAVLENTEALANFHSGGAYYTAERAVISPAIPFHAGAVRYLKEIDAWTDELEEIQQSLLR